MRRGFKAFQTGRRVGRTIKKTSPKSNMKALPAKAGFTVIENYSTARWEPQYTKEYTPLMAMNKNALFLTLSVQSETYKNERMQRFIEHNVRMMMKRGDGIILEADKDGNIYVTKGVADVYPTIVAHTDTVHDIVPNSEYQVRSDGIKMWAENPKTGAYTGVGGDDKVGIFIALSMLALLPVVKVAFFVDEEIGCKGSLRADMTFFENSAFVLQCDRRGTRDFVNDIMFTQLYGKDFSTALAPYLTQTGYSETDGGMTDVWQLKLNGLKVACANMSCGYFSPHTSWETVGLVDVQRCFDLVYLICTKLGDRQWKHGYVRTYQDTDKWWQSTTWDTAWYGAAKDTQKKTDEWIATQKAKLRNQEGYRSYTGTGGSTGAISELYPDQKDWASNLTVSQLLEDDRQRIAAAIAQNTEYLPECPLCRTNGTVLSYADDDGFDYWCITCELPFSTGRDIITEFPDDETQMPDEGDRIRVTA